MYATVAICDDDAHQCVMLSELIRELHPDYVITCFPSGKELLQGFVDVDLVILDIDMPEQNGLETARLLREQEFRGQIVFLTNHSEFMPEAFDVLPFRYLSKPINLDSIRHLFDELEKSWNRGRKILIDQFGTQIVLLYRDILYIKSDRKTTTVYLPDQHIPTSITMKDWTGILQEPDFCQVHKSYLVSLAYLDHLEPDFLLLSHAKENIPIAKRRYKHVRDTVAAYIRRNARLI